MAENTLKNPKNDENGETINTPKGNSKFGKQKQQYILLQWLNQKLSTPIETIIEHAFSPKAIPYILFWAFLAIIYITNAQYAEKMVRQTNKLEAEVENLRANYITLKSAYDAFAGKQAEILRSADSLGLVENKERIFKIMINDK
jgi:hypothetical protein